MRLRSCEFLRARFEALRAFVDDPPFESRSSHEAAGHGSRRRRGFPPDTTRRESEMLLLMTSLPSGGGPPVLPAGGGVLLQTPSHCGSEVSPSKRPTRWTGLLLQLRLVGESIPFVHGPPSEAGLLLRPRLLHDGDSVLAPTRTAKATRGGYQNSAIRIITPICPVRLFTTQNSRRNFLRYVGKHWRRIAEREISDLEAGD